MRFTKTTDEDEGEGDDAGLNWIQKVQLAGRTAVKSWSKNLNDKGDHKPLNEEVRIEGKLPLGAYLLEARSGSLSARDLVLITDVSAGPEVVAKQALVYFAMR